MKNGKVHVWLPTLRAGSGADVFTNRLAQALEKRGLSVQIDWFSARHEVAPFLLRSAPAPAGTDIVFANSWNGFAFKRENIPLVIISLHPEFTSTDPQFGILRRLYHRLLIRRYQELSFRAANAITAISTFTARSLEHTPHAKKLSVTHLWIDLEKFRPGAGILQEQEPFRLLFVGNLSYRKGVDLLPPIMQALGPRFHLDIVASPDGDTGRFDLPNITMLGRLDEADLIQAYQHCDALLFPSRWEGFGYTALEAMACGKPVIASNASALPEVVEDGVTGILCEPGDVDAFTIACKQLAEAPERARAMGLAGRERAMREFSEDRLISRYEDLINKA